MDGRKITVQIKFRVTEEERALIEEKMKLIPTRKTAIASSLLCCGFVTQLSSGFGGKGIFPLLH